METIHVADKGTIFAFTFTENSSTVDLSSADTTTARVVYFQNPTGSVTSAVMSFPSGASGTSGVLNYTVPTTTFFNVAGQWSVQGKVVITDGEFHTDIQHFTVYENLA